LVKVGKGLGATVLKSVVPGAAAALEAASGAMKLIKAARGPDKAKAAKAKLALKAADAQATLETKAGKQLPVPSSVRAKGPAAANAFRYLVTVKHAEAA